jgi:hypothetical protein
MMKKFLFSAALLAASLSLLAQDSTQNLCQKWKISFEDAMKDIPVEVAAMLEALPKSEKDEFYKQMKEQFDTGYIIFYEAGDLESFFNNVQGQGTWRFVDDGKAIESTENDKTTTLDILVLNADRMVLKERGNDESPNMTFIPFDN